jgi:selenide,water dikinase
VGDDVDIAEIVSKEVGNLLFDPQTAGGLLISISAGQSDALLARLRETYPHATNIGRVVEHRRHSIIVS